KAIQCAKGILNVGDRNVVFGEMANGMRGNGPMHHIKVDVVGLQTSEARFAMLNEFVRIGMARTYFCRDKDAIARNALKGSTEAQLAGTGVIGFGGVKEVAAMVHGVANDFVRFMLSVRAPILPAAVSPAAKSQ